MTHYDSSCAQTRFQKRFTIFSFHCPLNILSLHQTSSSFSFILQNHTTSRSRSITQSSTDQHEQIYKRLFRVSEYEKLFKTYQCYLSTTAGPIAGLLFISSTKMAFCSERSVKVTSPQGDMIRIHYKVSISLCKIERVNQSQNTNKPSHKYLEVVTVDGFDFWFMGFLSYQKAFHCLEKALSEL